MARLALFSLGFLVYTAVAAMAVAQHPAQYLNETKARVGMAGGCSSATSSAAITRLNKTSTL